MANDVDSTRNTWNFRSSQFFLSSVSSLYLLRASNWLLRLSCGEKRGGLIHNSITDIVYHILGMPLNAEEFKDERGPVIVLKEITT